jgi:hypothetical protein
VRVRDLAVILTVSATVLMAVSGLTACTSSKGGSGLPNPFQSATGGASPASAAAFGVAASKQYGFSLKVPLGWVSASTSAKAGDTSGAPLESVSWTNPKGKVVAGHYVDALQVSVYAMTKAVKPADLVKHARDFKGIAYGLIKGLPTLAVTDPIKPITVNGTKGFQVTYTYAVDNTPTGAMSYLLPKGRYAYWITGQASSETWTAAWSKLTPAMAAFTIKPVATK